MLKFHLLHIVKLWKVEYTKFKISTAIHFKTLKLHDFRNRKLSKCNSFTLANIWHFEKSKFQKFEVIFSISWNVIITKKQRTTRNFEVVQFESCMFQKFESSECQLFKHNKNQQPCNMLNVMLYTTNHATQTRTQTPAYRTNIDRQVPTPIRGHRVT